MENKISVIIPIYINSKANEVKEALESIISQTKKPDEILIIIDGPVIQDVDFVISTFIIKNPQICTLKRYSNNLGIGVVLFEGVKQCKYDIIARMDSDDIAVSNRFQKQLAVINEKNVDIVGSYIGEFYESKTEIRNIRVVPIKHDDIKKFSKKRNPMNHMTVMFKKNSVIDVGGYSHIAGFEDYYLWTRMLINNSKFYNINECLVITKSGDEVYKRRGGLSYIKNEIYFEKKLLKAHYITFIRFIINVVTRVCVRIIPNGLRGLIYKTFLRS